MHEINGDRNKVISNEKDSYAQEKNAASVLKNVKANKELEPENMCGQETVISWRG